MRIHPFFLWGIYQLLLLFYHGCRSGTRTRDIQVMSLTSCQLLYPAIYIKDSWCTFFHATNLKIKTYSITEKMSLNIQELPICFSPFCLPQSGMVPPTFTNHSEIYTKIYLAHYLRFGYSYLLKSYTSVSRLHAQHACWCFQHWLYHYHMIAYWIQHIY